MARSGHFGEPIQANQHMPKLQPTPKRSFSRISKIFFALTIGPWFATGVVLVCLGNFSEGLGLLVFSEFLAIFPLIGLFFLRHPVQGRSANLDEEMEKFKLQYPGAKGKIAYYGLTIGFAVAILLRLTNFVK